MKIISGGQTGADQAGVDAAKFYNLETGGWMPHGWTTLNGSKPEYAELYGMQEHKSVGYPPRTKQNVFDSDGTLIIAGNFSSPGTKLTINATSLFKKPVYTSDFNNPTANEAENIHQWIIEKNIKILNIAGNSESSFPGIYEYSRSLLILVFEKL